MIVLHICYRDRGGAAQAAIRFHKEYLRRGVTSEFLFLGPSTKEVPNSHYVYEGSNKSKIYTLLKKLKLKHSKEERQKKRLLRIKGDSSFEGFSFSTSSINIRASKVFQQADIIHLHWAGNLVDFSSVFKNLNKPVFWTFHDMNPFLGGLHYQGDLNRNRDNAELIALNQKELDIKAKALSHFKALTVITPSEWLKKASQESEIFKNYPHYHIANGLDTQIFKYYDPTFARSVFNIPTDKKIFLFVSDRLGNYRKGMDLLKGAIDSITLKEEIVICTLGEGNFSINKNNIQPLPLHSINDERLISLLYAAVDYVIIPSREDNLPNVMIEAMACGTPIISFPIGGMKEIIQTGFNGILAKNLSADALKIAIEEAISDKYIFSKRDIIDYAQRHFNIVKQADKYLALYKIVSYNH
ncbi:glycosyltransferase [Porifericola rhodea]|uniref:glycosyltransferase n=1 Tax=Porifericola rhodea TaxID=930972 RepID=UPI0026652653|nr:glycosyltransferase [Porifericola rhodea]WKN33492.1 glycosyltransferase [Porifericola rhodea]